MNMTRPSRTIADPAQVSFFDTPSPVAGPELSTRLREALAEALASAKETAGRDRYAVAAEMSRLMGRDMTKNMLDRYTAPSADEWRFPLEALPALIAATGDTRIVTIIVEACGFKAMPGEATAIAELVALELQSRALKKRIAAARKRMPPPAQEWAEKEAERRGRR